MTLPREDVIAGLPAELEDFEQLVRSLDAAELATPTSPQDGSTVSGRQR